MLFAAALIGASAVGDDPASVLELAEPFAGPGIVEFYAPWCSHCRAFAPEFASLAAAAASADIPVQFGRINCDVVDCNKWGITRYPTVAWVDDLQYKWVEYTGALDRVSVARWADGLAELQSKIQYARMPPPTPAPTTMTASWRSAAKPSASDVLQGADNAFEAIFPLVAKGAIDVPLSNSIRVVAAALAPFGRKYHRLALALHPNGHITQREWAVVAKEWSTPTQRAPTAFCGASGSACQAWTLLHTLAARADDAVGTTKAAAILVAATLKCSDCVEHWLDAVHNGIPPMVPALEAVSCRQSVILWLWRVHNSVNERPGVNHPPFPTPSECAKCESDDDVFVFLEEFYTVPPPFEPWELLPASALVGPLTTALVVWSKKCWAKHAGRQ